MDTLKAILDCRINYKGTKANPSLASSVDAQLVTHPITYTTGVGANQANEVLCVKRTIAGGATDDVDIYGVLSNNLGVTFSPARIKAIAVFLLTDTPSTSIQVGGYGANAWVGPFGANTHTQKVINGGFYCNATPDATGWVVTDSTGDKLRIVNNDGSNTATYLLVLIAGLT